MPGEASAGSAVACRGVGLGQDNTHINPAPPAEEGVNDNEHPARGRISPTQWSATGATKGGNSLSASHLFEYHVPVCPATPASANACAQGGLACASLPMVSEVLRGKEKEHPFEICHVSAESFWLRPERITPESQRRVVRRRSRC